MSQNHVNRSGFDEVSVRMDVATGSDESAWSSASEELALVIEAVRAIRWEPGGHEVWNASEAARRLDRGEPDALVEAIEEVARLALHGYAGAKVALAGLCRLYLADDAERQTIGLTDPSLPATRARP